LPHISFLSVPFFPIRATCTFPPFLAHCARTFSHRVMVANVPLCSINYICTTVVLCYLLISLSRSAGIAQSV
jgi:hypothetical protein